MPVYKIQFRLQHCLPDISIGNSAARDSILVISDARPVLETDVVHNCAKTIKHHLLAAFISHDLD